MVAVLVVVFNFWREDERMESGEEVEGIKM
jgi:hypothetical protein